MYRLSEISPLPPEGANKTTCKEELGTLRRHLFELQNVFYADRRFGLLILLQGLDTAGKDGTIRHVITCMNPMGVHVKSFKKPTEIELAHDFLWRAYPNFPAKGMIEVFNRSYYEDILIPSVYFSQEPELLEHRMNMINALERHLALNDVLILKFFLHISREEQEQRIQERLTKPHKKWKYSKEDEVAAKRWNDYTRAYDALLNNCNQIPWNIIPAEKRWYRNYAVAQVIKNQLTDLDLKYPFS